MSRVSMSIAAIAVAATLASGSSAFADELQVFCAGTTTCGTNGVNITTTNPTPTFGLLDTGGPATGTLFLDILSPTKLATGPTVTSTPAGFSGTLSLISPTAWSTSPPDLGVFQFGANGPKGNPISALGQGGPFFVYSIEFTGITLPKMAGTPTWTTSTLPLFSVILGFFDVGGTGACTNDPPPTGNCVKTANSEALFITPLPGALPLFATGLVGLGLLGWRRKKIVNLSA